MPRNELNIHTRRADTEAVWGGDEQLKGVILSRRFPAGISAL
jgi:hypothetical protein